MNTKLPAGNFKKLLPVLLVVAGLLVSFRTPLMGIISHAELKTEIQHQPILMPAVYKVYANDNALNGKYSLFKMLLTNTSHTTAKNVEVSYQLTNFVDWTSIDKIPVLLPGQSVVVNCYPSLPDKIVDKTTSSKEKVNIKITGSNVSEDDEEFDIEVKGRNEFMYSCIPADEIRTAADMDDNMDLLTCFVTPDDPIIKYYTQKIQEKILKGEAASVENKDEEGVRFLSGIYYATLISHMVYSGTSGVPEKVDDISSLVQSLRLPREVITGKTGLCIELSILYSSIMAAAGMDPVIYLIPGHAYPGFKMNGHYYAIEATGIGGEGIGGRMSPDQAYQAGMKELNQFIEAANAGDDRYRLVDVRDAISKGAVAMELKDDSYLRQKVDEITDAWDGGNAKLANTNVQNNQQDNYTEDNKNTGSRLKGYNLFQGFVNFSYPGSWRMMPRNAQSMPQLKYLIANSNNSAYVEVYQFQGYSNPTQALYAIQQYVSNYGASLQFKATGNARGYTLYSGQTTYNGGGINWVAAFKATGSGVVGIATGANLVTGNTYQSTIMNIINSIN